MTIQFRVKGFCCSTTVGYITDFRVTTKARIAKGFYFVKFSLACQGVRGLKANHGQSHGLVLIFPEIQSQE